MASAAWDEVGRLVKESATELTALLGYFQPGSISELKTDGDLTRRLYRHRLIEIIHRVALERADPTQLAEVGKRLDRLERAAFGVSARDRVLRGLDEMALEFAPRYEGNSEDPPSENDRLWRRCLAARAKGDAYWSALLELAKYERALETEMDVETFKHTVFSAWARSGRKRPTAKG